MLCISCKPFTSMTYLPSQLLAYQLISRLSPCMDHRRDHLAFPDLFVHIDRPRSPCPPLVPSFSRILVILRRCTFWKKCTTCCRCRDPPVYHFRCARSCAQGCDNWSSIYLHRAFPTWLLYIRNQSHLWMGESPVGHECVKAGSRQRNDIASVAHRRTGTPYMRHDLQRLNPVCIDRYISLAVARGVMGKTVVRRSQSSQISQIWMP